MKIEPFRRNTRHNNLILTLLLISIFLITTQHSYSQKKQRVTDSINIYKNSLKGLLVGFPFVGGSISVGYERNVSEHSTLELSTNYFLFIDEMGLKNYYLSIMPAYKYYTVSKNDLLNNFWISGYLLYLYNTHKHPESENDIRHSLYHYGIGGSIGRRIDLGSDKKTFIDVGFGISYSIYDDKPISTNNDWANRLIYRPIIQFGRKF